MVRPGLLAALGVLAACGVLGPVDGHEGCIDAMPTFTGRLESDAGEVVFDRVQVNLEHGDEAAEQPGCLTLASLTFTEGDALDCALIVTTENRLDGEGRLVVTGVSLDGTGPCTVFPSALQATYLEQDLTGSGVVFGGAVDNPGNTFDACYDSFLEIQLAGTLTRVSGSDAAVETVDITGTTFRVEGPMPSTPVADSCPAP